MIYSAWLALKSIWFSKWTNLLAALTIGAGLFIFGFVLFLLYNLEGISGRLPERFSVSLFLSEKLRDRDIQMMKKRLESNTLIQSVRYISKEEALKELKETMEETAYILEGLDENPLFPSFELRLRKEGFDGEKVKTLLEKLGRLRGVEDVVYGADVLKSIRRIRAGFRSVSAGILILFSMAVLFISYSTVRMLFLSHAREIGIFKLLGATRIFIQVPFLMEGALIGLSGGLLAALGMYGMEAAVRRMVISGFSILRSLQVPVEILYALPVAGAMLGIAGAAIAVGRVRLR